MIQDLTLEINPEDQNVVELLREPSQESEFVSAKTFLQKASTKTGDNLYDHLCDVLNKILAERPEDVIDFFEEYSRKVKERRFKSMTDHFEDIFVAPGAIRLAKKIIPLLKPITLAKPTTLDPDELALADLSRNDMFQMLYYMEHAGIGLPRPEMFYLTVSIKQLVYSQPIASIHFWGKIFGTRHNYLILEAELKLEEYAKRNAAALLEIEGEESSPPAAAVPDGSDDVRRALDVIGRRQEVAGEDSTPRLFEFPPLPPILWEESPEPPVEPTGVGINRKVYYVCNEIGAPWIELPDVTPKQIRVARNILKNFTGDLDHPIRAYPEFPGTERNLLRAQIARITAGTHISPLGFYTFEEGGGGEEEEVEEEEAVGGGGGKNQTDFHENPHYDPVPLKDLIDGTMLSWAHHSPYILPQGRTTWWNPYPLPDMGEEMDEAMGEEEEEPETKGPMMEPETGPALLSSCAEDVSRLVKPVWSVRCSSQVLEDFAIAIIQSNIWPGAYCFTTQGKLFANMYMGYGTKYIPENFTPMPLPPVEQDYPLGPEIMEILDPTGAQEEEWRIAHLPKIPPIPDKLGEEEAAGEEEEEEEDD